MATRPATAPDTAPSTVGFPLWAHSTIAHVRAAAAEAVFVARNALALKPPEESALPALNPNHPNHRRAPPSTTIGILCGGIDSVP